ncbi:MAG TPA: serine/threonine-protein kinase [Polyangiaceae bacterium]|jgi:serine/threonine-protein kinase
MRPSEPSSPVAAGDVLAGKYRVERVIGAGGMGVVVAARHLQLDQLVALKFVVQSVLDETMATERFLREARAAVKLKSEHVAKVMDVGTLENGAPFMVMEYLEGSDLSAVIEREAPLPVEMATDFLIQACEALSEAHAHGIVHRDLKPQNLFLTKGVGGAHLVKVLDFGISKIRQPAGAQNLTQTTTVMGSPLYMAPEQMRSARHVDHRTDIWALGVVLHEMLTKKLPFEAESMTELALKIVQDPLVPIEHLRPDLPPELAAVVHRCLEKDLNRRFADAGELAEALEPFAPAASRVIVDRARKVISGLQQTMGMAAGMLPSVQSVHPSGVGSGSVRAADPYGSIRNVPIREAASISSPTHKSPGTPEPWSDSRPGTLAGTKKGSALIGAAAGAAVLVLGLLAYRATLRPPPPADPAPPPAAARAVADPGPTPPVPPAPVPVPAATAERVPAPPPASAASAARTDTAQVAAATTAATTPARNPSAAAPRTPRSAPPHKPAATSSPKRDTNDDIPALR